MTDKVETLYNSYLKIHSDHLEEGYDALEIAAASLATTLSLYKTALSDKDFDRMMDKISESRTQVKSFTMPTNIH